MREILFRGFHKFENGTEKIYLNGEEIKGKWVYGSLLQLTIGYQDKYYIVPTGTYYNEIYDETIKENLNAIWEEQDFFEVIPETVGQWSGLTNQYNQKIFEHDILREYSNEIEDWEVSYEYGKFEGTYDNCCEDLYELSDLEVIGTIFDKEVK